jgi:hypothetical protein
MLRLKHCCGGSGAFRFSGPVVFVIYQFRLAEGSGNA